MFNENTRIKLEKEMIMTFRIDIKSLIVGLLVGFVAVFVLGATTSRNEGVYKLSMAANEDFVFYGRVHTGTGRIETQRILVNSTSFPLLDDDREFLLGPEISSNVAY